MSHRFGLETPHPPAPEVPSDCQLLVRMPAFAPVAALPTKRVVITGLGLVSPLGVTVKDAWKRLQCPSATFQPPFVECTSFPCEDIPHRTVAPCSLSMEDTNIDKSDRHKLSRAMMFAAVAAEEALKQAGLFTLPLEKDTDTDTDTDTCTSHDNNPSIDRASIGVAIGSGIGSLPDSSLTTLALERRGYTRVSPYYIPKILPNAAASYVAMRHGFHGPLLSSSTACAAGLHAIADAFRLIQVGDAEIVICGGSEATICRESLAGFSRLHALGDVSRPFDVARQGFVMAEGAGILVLESEQHALQRVIPILGEIRGFGATSDAHHTTAPHPQGLFIEACMRRALQRASIDAGEVTGIVAHATSTPMGDAIEWAALQRLFPPLSQLSDSDDLPIPVMAAKGSWGHGLGAAGAMEAILSVCALQPEAMFPPIHGLQTHLDEKHAERGIRCVREESYMPPNALDRGRIILQNAFGFGGTNASIVWSSYH